MDEKSHMANAESGVLAESKLCRGRERARNILDKYTSSIYLQVGLLGSLFALTLLATWARITTHDVFRHQTTSTDSFLPTGKEIEEMFLSVPNPTSALLAHRLFATEPHMAGTPRDLTTAKLFLQILRRELGIPHPSKLPMYDAGSSASRNATLSIHNLTQPVAWIDKYYPYMNTPLNRSLQILGENNAVDWEANIEEVADDTDPQAGRHAQTIPAFHGLSKDGDVNGTLVYANYGRKEDYDALVKSGANLTGKIVITRYGGIFRGLKVKGAQELGAAGVLIYSDPRDDGTVTPDNGYNTYPYGPARNPTSVQRGSVQFLSIYPGDPSTPGYPAYKNATRANSTNVPSIPSLPISWNNAKVLLQELGQFGGEGKNRTVRLVNHVDDKVIPIWNTYGVIPGKWPDEVVVIGNHRDAWVMGATDPSSGTASVHEVIRGLGRLLRMGWKPLRTIVIASWDAEEYGLIGSTEWGEDFADWIDAYVVAYLNLDSSVSGSRFRASASPSLAHLARGAAERIPHPTKPGKTLWDAHEDSGPLHGKGLADAEAIAVFAEQEQANLSDFIGVNPLGSGSDFTVFLQRIGVASANGGFGPTLSDPVYPYHSVFDTVRWQETYCDPGFVKHVAVSKWLGLQTLGLADSIILPFNTTHYTKELEFYTDRIEALAINTFLKVHLGLLRASIQRLQSASTELDLEKHVAEKDLRHLMHHSHRHPLWSKLRKTFCRIRQALGRPCTGERRRRRWRQALERVQRVNKALAAFERGFISKDGLPGREWYRHLGVAPGRWLGYGATTFPGLAEALRYDRNETQAALEAERIRILIESLTITIRP